MAHPCASNDDMGEEEDYYKVLGVPFEATEPQIRARFQSLVRTLHPDRRRPGDNTTVNQFCKVQVAWRCLSDETRRLLYDLRNFHKSSLTGQGEGIIAPQIELNRMQQEQAQIDLRNMEYSYERVHRREQSRGGVVIKEALYGELRLKPELLTELIGGNRTITKEDLLGPVNDVTKPVQHLVEQHKVLLQGGRYASKADLPGFYNPCPLDAEAELALYVRYLFKRDMHEVLVGDHDMLRLPLRDHKVPAGRHPRGPFSPANVTMLRSMQSSGSVASSPDAGASSSSEDARRISSVVSSTSARVDEQVFNMEVDKYRFASLKSCSKGDPTPKEFVGVLLAAGMALVAHRYLH